VRTTFLLVALLCADRWLAEGKGWLVAMLAAWIAALMKRNGCDVSVRISSCCRTGSKDTRGPFQGREGEAPPPAETLHGTRLLIALTVLAGLARVYPGANRISRAGELSLALPARQCRRVPAYSA
jgi:hypothetical protein